MVPGGGLSSDGRWLAARKNYLIPVKALSRLFRGIFMEHAKRALPAQIWPASVWKQNWVVFAKATLRNPETLLKYLGRYVHRVAITNSRILSIDDGRVAFRYRRVADAQGRTMTLSAHEFIRRFLQHVLPNGFHKVRYYGLWAPAHRRTLRRLQESFRQQDDIEQTESLPADRHDQPPSPAPAEPLRCPQCHEGHLRWVARVRPCARDPPHA